MGIKFRNSMRFLLWPFSVIYGLVTHTRNKLFDHKFLKQVDFDLPVISIGNITVGGTGKTPLVEYLVSLLKDKYKVAVLSRGYKRKTNGFLIANENSSVSEIGDESSQIKSKFPGIIVAVDNNRVNGIEKLQQKVTNLEAVILDDAFQHRYVKAGLSVLLMEYNRLITSDHMLPYGRLREYACNSKRADIVVVTKTKPDLKPIDARIIQTVLQLFPYQKLYFSTIQHLAPLPVFKLTHTKLIDWGRIQTEGLHVLCLTGIANPGSFLKIITHYTKNTNLLKFPDHHNFSNSDLQKIQDVYNRLPEGSVIVTTEKDAARLISLKSKLSEEIIKNVFYLPIEINFLFDKGQEFDDLVLQFIKK